MVRRITSHSNETLKRVRSLREKKYRVREGLFLAEGMRIVAEAVEAGSVPQMLIHAEEAAGHPLLQRLAAATEAAGGDVIETTRDILAKLSSKDNPQSLLGVFAARETALESIDRDAAFAWVVCQSLKDPGNLGTILRTASAVRASMGALFTQALVQTDGPSFLRWLRQGAGQLVGASLNTSHDYQAVRYERPTFVFMGNEQSGLPAEYEAACDTLVKIPMVGKADSLNVAVSCAVLLYEVFNQARR